MTGVASGVGTAHDASVVAIDDIAGLEQALVEARQRQDARQPVVELERAEAKVAKLRDHLAAAEAEVARRRAELEA